MTNELDDIITEVGSELDKLGANGKQFSRRMIVEIAVQRGYQAGKDAEALEWVANLRTLMQKREP